MTPSEPHPVNRRIRLVRNPLAAFLHARLDEEEGEAGAASITYWRQPSPNAWTSIDGHGERVVQRKERHIVHHVAR